MFACWSQNGLCIQPNENLVSNVGAGPGATNFKVGHRTTEIPTVDLNQYVHPVAVFQNKEADRFTFNECIAPPKIPWVQQLRDSTGTQDAAEASALQRISFP
jgi:hypothetical protein